MYICIIGGTGTLGQAVTKKLLKNPYNIITIFSRDELKQKKMREELACERLKFVMGDVRDYRAVENVLHGMSTVFHFAALKHVDIGEFNPEEFVKTNVNGVINASNAAIKCGVGSFIFSSTDKAVDPINAYGMTKALGEKLIIAKDNTQTTTKFTIFRWGNVIGSRGSVIPYFVDAIKNNKVINITHPDMTRFWIKIDDAVDFMLTSYDSGTRRPYNVEDFKVKIPPIKAARVSDVIDALMDITGVEHEKYKIIGIRPGEKIHETLMAGMSSDSFEQYTEAELQQLLREFCA